MMLCLLLTTRAMDTKIQKLAPTLYNWVEPWHYSLTDMTHLPYNMQAGGQANHTFMEYIHGQLNITSWGLSDSMAMAIPFLNMA